MNISSAKNGIDPQKDLTIDQSIDFGSTAAAFTGDDSAEFTVEFEPSPRPLSRRAPAMWWLPSAWIPVMCLTPPTARRPAIWKNIRKLYRNLQTACRKEWKYVQTHTPAEIAVVIAPQFPETDLETITTIVTRYYEQDTWKENLVFEKESFELLQDILEGIGRA